VPGFSQGSARIHPVTQVVIIGGGPGGYEAALVAAQLGAQVQLVSNDALGGATVLTDCVPSKTLIATAESITTTSESGELGVRLAGVAANADQVSSDLLQINKRIKSLALAQSADITTRLLAEKIELISGEAAISSPGLVTVGERELKFDVLLIATGARPRVMPSIKPDGDRVLDWQQLYDLIELPPKLIVIGSGVTGAEFASAYNAIGSDVTLISSRDRVLPSEDPDAAAALEKVFARRGMKVINNARAAEVVNTGTGVQVKLTSGEVISGSHALVAIGSLPNTENIGLTTIGVKTSSSGYIEVDRVSRTSVRNVYAAGDCTGVLPLASVAAMQGRIAMYHALGDAVSPLDLQTVSSNVFTDPEIASVGVTQLQVDSGEIPARTMLLSLAGNARAKMQGQTDGFVKLFSNADSGVILGGVVVARNASELIYPIAIAVEQRLTTDQLAHTFTVYPSLTGSIAEAARRLHRVNHGTEQ
jgi:pyruvate/2-oxoglutarate dehydrogenase complex dihydrolipoamide dehydrogenase (E3) component